MVQCPERWIHYYVNLINFSRPKWTFLQQTFTNTPHGSWNFRPAHPTQRADILKINWKFGNITQILSILSRLSGLLHSKKSTNFSRSWWNFRPPNPTQRTDIFRKLEKIENFQSITQIWSISISQSRFLHSKNPPTFHVVSEIFGPLTQPRGPIFWEKIGNFWKIRPTQKCKVLLFVVASELLGSPIWPTQKWKVLLPVVALEHLAPPIRPTPKMKNTSPCTSVGAFGITDPTDPQNAKYFSL